MDRINLWFYVVEKIQLMFISFYVNDKSFIFQIKFLVFSHLTFEKEPLVHVVFLKILVNRLSNSQAELPELWK